MAIVSILLSCVLGAIAGLVHLAWLGGSVGQAFLTYLTVSLILSATAIGAAMAIAWFRPDEDNEAPVSQDGMETWQDWYTEEAMEADRHLCTAVKGIDGPSESRPSDSFSLLNTTQLADATVCSARRAGKV